MVHRRTGAPFVIVLGPVGNLQAAAAKHAVARARDHVIALGRPAIVYVTYRAMWRVVVRRILYFTFSERAHLYVCGGPYLEGGLASQCPVPFLPPAAPDAHDDGCGGSARRLEIVRETGSGSCGFGTGAPVAPFDST